MAWPLQYLIYLRLHRWFPALWSNDQLHWRLRCMESPCFFSTTSPLPSSSSSCHNHHTNETLWKHTCRVTVPLHTQDIYAHLVYLQTSAANPRQNQFLFPLGVFKNIFLRDKPSHLAPILLPFELCSLFKMGLGAAWGQISAGQQFRTGRSMNTPCVTDMMRLS